MGKLFSKQRGTGPSIILLHGFPMHHGIWEHFSELLATDHTVIAIDLPGFGSSPLPKGKTEFSLDDVADEVIAFTEEHNLEGATIVGHSLGGYVSLAAIRKRLDLFSSLILF